MRLWDLRAPQQPVQVLAAHTFAVRRVRFCPHSAAQLLSASYDMSVCLWDVVTATHRPLQQYNHHSEFVIGLEWSLFQEGWPQLTLTPNPALTLPVSGGHPRELRLGQLVACVASECAPAAATRRAEVTGL